MKTSALIKKLKPYLRKGYQTRIAKELAGKISRTHVNQCCNDVRQSDLVDNAIIQEAENEKLRLKKQAERVKAITE